MSRTVIDLDDEALQEAARHLGTTTKRDTVNAALREIDFSVIDPAGEHIDDEGGQSAA